MESQKLEQSSAPDDPAWESSKKFLDEHQHCHPHTEAVSDCFRCSWRYFRDVSIERIASLTAQVATLESDKAAAHEAGFAEAREAAAKEAIDFHNHLFPSEQNPRMRYVLERIAGAIRSLSAPIKEQQR